MDRGGATGMMTGQRTTLRVRPKGSLVTTGVASVALAAIPASAAITAIAREEGNWPLALAMAGAVLVGGLAVLLRQLSVYSEVTPSTLRGRGIFSPMIEVPLGEIHQVLLVQTTSRHALDTATQLLVRGSDGRRLFRMRGNFYAPGTLDLVAGVLPVEAERIDDPIALSRFFANYPGSAYWFENRPALRVAAVVSGCVIAVIAAATVMSLVGLDAG